jgi:hypothetical protein
VDKWIDEGPALAYCHGSWVIFNKFEQAILIGEAEDLFWLIEMRKAYLSLGRYQVKKSKPPLRKLKNIFGQVA